MNSSSISWLMSVSGCSVPVRKDTPGSVISIFSSCSFWFIAIFSRTAIFSSIAAATAFLHSLTSWPKVGFSSGERSFIIVINDWIGPFFPKVVIRICCSCCRSWQAWMSSSAWAWTCWTFSINLFSFIIQQKNVVPNSGTTARGTILIYLLVFIKTL